MALGKKISRAYVRTFWNPPFLIPRSAPGMNMEGRIIVPTTLAIFTRSRRGSEAWE